MFKLIAVACLLLCAAANAQVRRAKPDYMGVIFKLSCEKVLEAALTMPGVPDWIANRPVRPGDWIHVSFAVPIAGKSAFVTLDRRPHDDQTCLMWLPDEHFEEARNNDFHAWVKSLPLPKCSILGAPCSDRKKDEFQNFSMEELRRIAADAGY